MRGDLHGAFPHFFPNLFCVFSGFSNFAFFRSYIKKEMSVSLELNKRPRMEWLDAMRGFTMILVVAYHVSTDGFAQNIKHSSALSFFCAFPHAALLLCLGLLGV